MRAIATFTILVGSLISGCSDRHSLDSTAADAFAVDLANREAESQFGIRPFKDGSVPELRAGQWHWIGRHGSGKTDIQADVSFAGDGSRPEVNIMLLISASIREF